MKLLGVSLARRLLKDERGQSMVMIAASMAAFIGIAGITIDLGHAYSLRQQLQASSNAAALAGAAVMPNLTAAATNVNAYSSIAANESTGQVAGKNAIPGLQNVVATPTYSCASSLTSNFGLGCAAVSGYSNGVNVVKVTQTAQVPLWFGGLFHVPAFNITASATASMAGGQNTPWNVAIVLDATSSMTSSDSGLQCSGTRESCALQGVQALLKLMYPCQAGATCTNSTGITPIDTVSLFVFPPVLTNEPTGSKTNTGASAYYACPSTIPTIEPYTFVNVTTNTSLPSNYTYQVVPTPTGAAGNYATSNTVATFAHDYKTSDASTALNTGSHTVIAAGAGGSGCTPGIQAKGGEGTYYAQAIYAAQTALVAQQVANPGSQNAIIILGDGDMSASSGLQVVSGGGTLNGTGSGSNKNSYDYPSAKGQCGQAILATQTAASAGTRVYTVGYGIASGGCSTDATYSATIKNSSGTVIWQPGESNGACTAMKDMASSPTYFFSDETSGGVCPSPNQLNFTQLKQIFQAIARGMTTPRLVPNGTT